MKSLRLEIRTRKNSNTPYAVYKTAEDRKYLETPEYMGSFAERETARAYMELYRA